MLDGESNYREILAAIAEDFERLARIVERSPERRRRSFYVITGDKAPEPEVTRG